MLLPGSLHVAPDLLFHPVFRQHALPVPAYLPMGTGVPTGGPGLAISRGANIGGRGAVVAHPMQD
jgi:hypothetical protein